jgi:hypothetical protein
MSHFHELIEYDGSVVIMRLRAEVNLLESRGEIIRVHDVLKGLWVEEALPQIDVPYIWPSFFSFFCIFFSIFFEDSLGACESEGDWNELLEENLQ